MSGHKDDTVIVHESGPVMHAPPNSEADKDDEPFFPNPYPALPVFNNPVFSKELEESMPEEKPLPLDTWHSDRSVRRPPASQIGEIYKSRREAWKETGWVHCLDFLGQGGFGKVYLGFRYEDRHANTPLISRKLCAIKEVQMRKGTVDSMDEGIAIEAYVLRACAHPNIVRLFTCYTIPSRSRFYFVLEFADGKDLQYEIFSSGLPNGWTLWEEYGRALFIGIVDGVAYLHDRGIAHRDIKPDNILIRISPDGQTKIPKIADFGLSVMYMGKVKPEGHRTQFLEKGACGTKNYMAPELQYIKHNWGNFHHFHQTRPIPVSQADLQHKLVDERNANDGANRRPICEFTQEYEKRFYRPIQVDVFALGVTLYVMLAGEQPYDVRNEIALVHMFRCEPMRNHWHIRNEAFDFILAMLEPNPSKRLNIHQVRNHHWMKGEVSGPDGGAKRILPAPYYGVYASPTPSSPRPTEQEAGHAVDPTPPPVRARTATESGSPHGSVHGAAAAAPGSPKPADAAPESRPRSMSGRGAAPPKLGALLNAFNSLAIGRGPVAGRQRSMSMGVAPGVDPGKRADALRVRSMSLQTPGPSRVRQPSPPPTVHRQQSLGPIVGQVVPIVSPVRHASAGPSHVPPAKPAPILSTLKEMASRVAAGVAGATGGQAGHKSESPVRQPSPSGTGVQSKDGQKEPIMMSTTVKSTKLPSVPQSSQGSKTGSSSSSSGSSSSGSSESVPGRSGRGRRPKKRKAKGRRTQ